MFSKKKKKDKKPMFSSLFKKEKKKAKKYPSLDLDPVIEEPPKLKDIENFSWEYPLILPMAHAHIHFDENIGELCYEIIEPSVTDGQKTHLKMLKRKLIDTVDVDLSKKSIKQSISYIFKRASKILEELNYDINSNEYNNLLYYVYRDFIGLERLDPIMHDPYVEDISCDGVGVPLYLLHRKYGSLRTNVVFKKSEKLNNFVINLSQRCGKYISYARPYMDGKLPDGSRVNATFEKEITTRGSTFTIRKFKQIPMTPLDLIKNKTFSKEIVAYLWLAIENGASILVSGGTATGKTTILNAISVFIPLDFKIVSIEDSVTGDSKILIRENKKIRNITIKEFVDNKINAEVLTLNNKGKIKFVKPSAYIKHRVAKNIYEILTSTGRKIKVTEDHSLFGLGEDKLKEVKPKELIEGSSFIAVPRKLPIKGEEISKINLMNHLEKFKKDFLSGEPISRIFDRYSAKELKISKNKYSWYKRYNIFKINDFIPLDFKFSDKELSKLFIKSKNVTKIPVLFKISKKFLEFCGLWVGDGSYDQYNKNSVIVSNKDKECRKIVKEIAEYIGANYSKMNDGEVSIRIHSTIFYKFMKNVLRFRGYSKNKKVPDFIWSLSNDQIKYFIRGYFSADGTMKKEEISCASQSYSLLSDLQGLLLRLNIIGRINDFNRRDKCINMSISSYENINKFKKIGFLQERKNIKLLSKHKRSTHTHSDIIPLSISQINEINDSHHKLCWPYLKGMQHIGRNYLQKIAIPESKYNDLSHSDIYWDKVKKVTKLNKEEIEVFDLSIPKYEKFLCNNIFVHNTREINLPHEHWIPAVEKYGFGPPDNSGRRYGEVTMFELLKESFRQNPDYVIVGEVRGKEANVLFQGMASGHGCLGTIHAADIQSVIDRLTLPPINISAELLSNLDILVSLTRAVKEGPSARRVREVSEVVGFDTHLDRINTEKIYVWNGVTDSFEKRVTESLKSFKPKTGVVISDTDKEIKARMKVIDWMLKNDIDTLDEIAKIVNRFYKERGKLLNEIKRKRKG